MPLASFIHPSCPGWGLYTQGIPPSVPPSRASALPSSTVPKASIISPPFLTPFGDSRPLGDLCTHCHPPWKAPPLPTGLKGTLEGRYLRPSLKAPGLLKAPTTFAIYPRSSPSAPWQAALHCSRHRGRSADQRVPAVCGIGQASEEGVTAGGAMGGTSAGPRRRPGLGEDGPRTGSRRCRGMGGLGGGFPSSARSRRPRKPTRLLRPGAGPLRAPQPRERPCPTRESVRDPVASTLFRDWVGGGTLPQSSRRPGSGPAPQIPHPRSQAQGSSVPSRPRSAARREAGRKWASRPSAASATSSHSARALAYSGASLRTAGQLRTARRGAGPGGSPAPPSGPAPVSRAHPPRLPARLPKRVPPPPVARPHRPSARARPS